MRKIFIFYLGLIVILSSCEKIESLLKSKCDYEYSNFRDTLLSVTFVESGSKFKFYQIRPALGDGAYMTSMIYNSNNYTNLIYKRNYLFNFSKDKKRESLLNDNISDFNIEFTKTFVYTNYIDFEKDSDPSTVFFSEMSVAYNKDKLMLNTNDTLFFRGVSFSNAQGYSTNNVFEYYNFKTDSIIKFFNDSFIKILSVQKECDNIYSIEGLFDVKLMQINSNSTHEIIHLQKGTFKIIRRFK